MKALPPPLPLLAPALAGAAAAAVAAPLVPRGAATTASLSVASAALAAIVLAAVSPWIVLPLATVGGAVAAERLGLASVAQVTAIHAGLLGAGLTGAGLRRAFDRSELARVRTAADVPMLILAGVAILGAAYGLARGNPPYAVGVALYQLGVIPTYFFATTLTLTNRRRLACAAVLFAAAATALAAVGLATPGRHGGLLSALALPVALALAFKTRGATRALLLGAGALLGVDVVLAAYRSVWLAAGIALAVLVVRGAPEIRRAVVGVLVVGVIVAVASIALLPGSAERSSVVAEQVRASAGYRLPEAALGMRAFLAAPVAGQGLGQVASEQDLPGLGVADVGPVYHAFYVTVLANTGIIGALVILWALSAALMCGRRNRIPAATAARALLLGFIAAAAFAAPTNGHWELGLLAALALLPAALTERGGAQCA